MTEKPSIRCTECQQSFARSYVKLCRACDNRISLREYIGVKRDYSIRPTMVCFGCMEQHEQDHILNELGGDEGN